MTFALYDAATDGSLIWGPESHAAVPVSEGLFSVGLGSIAPIPTSTWNGDRYLEVTVGGETLSPRELIRSVPRSQVAQMALTVPDGAIGSSQIAVNAVTGEKIAAGAVTQEEAPTLIKSANGQNEIILSGNQVFNGTDSNGYVTVNYPCFPHRVRTFIALNGDWNANPRTVVGHGGAGACSVQVKMSSSTSNLFRLNWIAIGN